MSGAGLIVNGRCEGDCTFEFHSLKFFHAWRTRLVQLTRCMGVFMCKDAMQMLRQPTSSCSLRVKSLHRQTGRHGTDG